MRRTAARPRLRWRRVGAAVAGAALFASFGVLGPAAAVDDVDGGAEVTDSAQRRGPAPDQERALLISDSAWLSIYLYGTFDAVQGFDHSLALASCRRRVATSCTNFDGFVPITLLEELRAHDASYTTLIVATGYNDSDGRFANEVAQIITTARSQGIQRVVWVTLRDNGTYVSPGNRGFAESFQRANATLRAIDAAGTYPELVLADWGQYSEAQTQWFSADGIHLRTRGSYAASDYVSRKMAFLLGEPCPQPIAAGQPVADPCVDPDVHGPIVDLDSLYPANTTNRQPFLLAWEGSSSWPNAPWWER